MNAHEQNSVFRAVVGIARSQCANHRRDDAGWPLGNCTECAEYRKKMDAWYMAQVMGGEAKPETAELFDRDKILSGAEDYTSNPKQAST